MVPVYGLETVAGACDQALLSGSVTRDRVLNLLSRANERGSARADRDAGASGASRAPLADCARYDTSGARSSSNGAR